MGLRFALTSVVLAVLALVISSGKAGAQTYPDRPVKIIVPIGPGGSYDFVGRMLADQLTKRLGQPFVVENRPGAGTNVGTQSVATAPPGWLHVACRRTKQHRVQRWAL